MTEAFIIYLYTVFSGVSTLALIFLIIGPVVAALSFMVYDMNGEVEKWRKGVKGFPKWVTILSYADRDWETNK